MIDTTLNFEQVFNNFRGENAERLRPQDVAKVLTDLFDIALYKQLSIPNNDLKISKIYNDNKSFWEDALVNDLNIGKTVKLEKFAVIEWLPYSPGLYFTPNAQKSRKRAQEYFNIEKAEYLPLGKLDMMLGGIGSVRLSSENDKYYLCATSTGISHQGIPLIVERETYNNLIDEIKESGSCSVDILGTIEILPTQKSAIQYEREIPKYSVVAKKIEKNKSVIKKEILVSISATFTETDRWSGELQKKWSFASFSPDKKDIELLKAVKWIEEYAFRYSEVKPMILSDFDEHKKHFESSIEFELKNVIAGKVNEELLIKYSEKFHVTINKTIMGNNYERISGTVITDNSGTIFTGNTGTINITNSFNKVKEKFGEDAANALAKVAEIVAKENNQEGKELFETFNEELQKDQPKKSLLKNLWAGITTAIPLLKSSVDIYDKVSTFFA